MNESTPLERGLEAPQPSAAPPEDSTWDKVSREAYVVVGGIRNSVEQNVQNIVENPGQSAPTFLATVAIGAGLAYLQGRTGMLKLAGQAIGLGLGVAFVKDLADPVRLNDLSQSLGNTWNSTDRLLENREQFARSGGQFAFDSVFMAGGAILGAGVVKAGYARGLFGEKQSLTLGFSNPPSSGSNRLPKMEFFTGETAPSTKARILTDADMAKPTSALIAEQTLKWDEAGALEWKPTRESLQMRREAQDFVQHAMKGDFVKAIDSRLQSEVMRDIELNPASRSPDIKTPAKDLMDADSLPHILETMSEKAVFKWDQTIVNGLSESETLKVVIPRLVMTTTEGNVPVALFDFAKTDIGYKIVFPEKSTSGATLTPGQLAEVQAIRASTNGKRILGETAVFAFEETFHAAQHANGGKPIVPSAAEDLKIAGILNDNRYFKQAFVGVLDRRLPIRTAFYEREIPAALFDAGMPLSMIKQHYFFGRRHVQERVGIMDYLEKLDQGKH
ncbi:MAG: hypothetical protein IAF58_11615 [Leptolyngbya sp.]|nr:hypothetical protein [Candidatus Melainabacteria bacterium]